MKVWEKVAVEDERFEQAMKVVEECAGEHILSEDSIDCDLCPCSKECRKFWFTYVCNGNLSITEVIEQFEDFKRRKRK